MAIIEPLAIGCGMMPGDLWGMTLTEILAVIDGRTKDREKEHEFLDHLNGVFCTVYASYHGKESCPRDYMITKSDPKTPALDMTPEAIQERAVESFRAAGA